MSDYWMLVQIAVGCIAVYLAMRSLKLWGAKVHLPPCPEGLPLLGNALQYKANPVAFVQKQAVAHAGVFTVNMSGTLIVLLAEESALKQYWNTREHTLSSRAAINDFGFSHMLGKDSVWKGTDIHRSIAISQLTSQKTLPGYLKALTAAGQSYLKHVVLQQPKQTHGNNKSKFTVAAIQRRIDLFATMRAAVFHSYVSVFVSQELADQAHFRKAYMKFQDSLEEATAKCVALPDIVSRWGVLDVQVQRKSLLKMLRPVIVAEYARWLEACPQLAKQTQQQQQEQVPPKSYLVLMFERITNTNTGGEKSLTLAPERVSYIASLVVSFLFAAHKNVAICASQTLLRTIVEQPAEETKKTVDVVQEVMSTLQNTQHVIGSMRKVVKKQGWTIETATGTRYTLPINTYVGGVHQVRVEGQGIGAEIAKNGGFKVVNTAYAPFSGGVHRCPGNTLAVAHTAEIVNQWRQMFELALVSEADRPVLDFTKATLAQTTHPVELTVTCR